MSSALSLTAPASAGKRKKINEHKIKKHCFYIAFLGNESTVETE